MKEKAQILDEFWLKVIAFVSMTFDHIGAFMMATLPSNAGTNTIATVFRIIGRLAFPLFLLFLSEGLRYTRNRKKYLFRLFIMWIAIALVQTAFYSYYRISNLNGVSNITTDFGASMPAQAFTDLLLYALFVYLIEHEKKSIRFLAVLPTIYILLSYVLNVLDQYGLKTNLYFPSYLRASYNLFGFLIFLGFYYAYHLTDIWVKKGLSLEGREFEEYQATPTYRKLVNTVSVSIFLAIVLILWGISYLDYHFDVYDLPGTKIQNYCLLDCFLILLYSGKRGYDKKWWRIFEYGFYPLHIAIIAIVFTLILLS